MDELSGDEREEEEDEGGSSWTVEHIKKNGILLFLRVLFLGGSYTYGKGEGPFRVRILGI